MLLGVLPQTSHPLNFCGVDIAIRRFARRKGSRTLKNLGGLDLFLQKRGRQTRRGHQSDGVLVNAKLRRRLTASAFLAVRQMTPSAAERKKRFSAALAPSGA